jgi:hypothetical protein
MDKNKVEFEELEKICREVISRILLTSEAELLKHNGSCSRFGRVELSISSHPAQAGLFSTRPGENPA